MESYKRATKRVLNRFLRHQISFAECIPALDAALGYSQIETGGAFRTSRLDANEQRNRDEGDAAAQDREEG